MTYGLVASALSRRFVLGPLIALALVGTQAQPFDGSGSTAPSPSPSASSVTPANAAGRALIRAHEAQGVFFVDNLVYAAAVGDELALITEIEPRVRWGTDVIVQLPTEELANSEVVILRAPVMGDGSLCIAEVSEVVDAGTYYAHVTGSGACPGRKAGMPGWSTDRIAGWGF